MTQARQGHHTHELGAVALATLLSTSAAFADTGPMTSPPVELDSCQYVQNREGTRFGVRVSYVNVAPVTATEVRILVIWNEYADPRGRNPNEYLRDVGTFSPNVTITHTFPVPKNDHDLTCTIVEVHFGDGTTWTEPLENQ